MTNNRYVPDDQELPGLRELFPESGAPAFVADAMTGTASGSRGRTAAHTPSM